MFCNACGQTLESFARFCSSCGAPKPTVTPAAPPLATPINVTQTTLPQERLRKAKVLLVITCVMLGAIALVALQIAESKLANQAAEKKRSAEESLLVLQAEDGFKRMTPEEHIALVRKDLIVNSDQTTIDEGMKNLEALQGTQLEKQGAALRGHYEAQKKLEDKAEAAEQARGAVKQSRDDAAAQELARVAYAKFLEDSLLRDDLNVDVTAFGAQHKFLKLKWILASKALAFNFTEQRQDMLNQMRQDGFTRFTITDGYDEAWTWNLTK